MAQTIGDLENGREIEAERVTQVFDSIRLHIDDRSVREMRGYAHPPDIVKAVMMGCVSMAKGVACKDFDDARRLSTSHLLQEIMDCDYHDLPGDASRGRVCHFALSSTVIDCHSLGVCIVTLLSLLSLYVQMTDSA